MKFLEHFLWTDTLLTETENRQLKTLSSSTMIYLPDIEWILGWTANSRWYSHQKLIELFKAKTYQCRSTLKKDLIFELALMHKEGIITVLPFSKHASPIFAQRKPKGNKKILVDLKKINTLTADDYTDTNHPVSTLSDATQHLAGSLSSASSIAPKHATVCR